MTTDIRIAPSILAADFARLGEHVQQAEAGGADGLVVANAGRTLARRSAFVCTFRTAGDTDVALTSRPTSIKTLEWERIHQTLVDTEFNISEAARRLGHGPAEPVHHVESGRDRHHPVGHVALGHGQQRLDRLGVVGHRPPRVAAVEKPTPDPPPDTLRNAVLKEGELWATRVSLMQTGKVTLYRMLAFKPTCMAIRISNR